LKRLAGNEKEMGGWVGRSVAIDTDRRTVTLLVIRLREKRGAVWGEVVLRARSSATNCSVSYIERGFHVFDICWQNQL
jgi:hypothetical protein